MSFIARPEALLDLEPAQALQIVTPMALTVAARLVEPPRSRRGPIPLRLTLAWERDGNGAAQLARAVDVVAKELLGPDGPERIRAGELRTPLRDGDAAHPGEPRLAGRVFLEVGGEIQAIADFRNPDARRVLDPLDPLTFEVIGPGSLLKAKVFLFARTDGDDGVRVQLTHSIAVFKGAPGWELWEPVRPALS